MSSREGTISNQATTDWTPVERESFFRSIERHRRAAWRVRAVSSAANSVVAFIIAVLMAPLFYAATGVVLDVLNLVVPMPNLVTVMVTAYRAAVGHARQGEWLAPLAFYFVTAMPGLLWMTLIIRMLSRVLRIAAGDSAQLHTRPAAREVLAEQRFVNVIEEMAIAAGLPAPAVLITERDMLNAAVRGNSERSAVIIVSEPLLAILTRQEMQAVAADLVASIANGDLAIGHRIALTTGIFGLAARFSKVLNASDGLRQLWQLLRALRHPSLESAQSLVRDIADPFGRHDGQRRTAKSNQASVSTQGARPSEPQKPSDRRLWLWAPLAGPVVMSGFFSYLVSVFVLRPLVAATWRQRKYMADAVAVRLTRDPDALASALGRMGSGQPFSTWMAHLSVVSTSKRDGVLGNAIVPMFPSLERRLRALRNMGANVAITAKRTPWDWRAFVLLPPLLTLMVVLLSALMIMSCYCGILMSALFTGVPFAVLHLLLRALGH